MILHTIANEYAVMGIATPTYQVRTVAVSGGYVECVQDASGSKAQVRRLISTNPALYLDKRYQPYSPYR